MTTKKPPKVKVVSPKDGLKKAKTKRALTAEGWKRRFLVRED
jgi:hypothetical protein